MSIVIPHDRLAADTLTRVIEEFVTRDGAVHGHGDVPLERQIEAVRRQLRAGQVLLVFDETDESCTLVHAEHRARIDASPQRFVPEE